jgi:hypothetical protein
MNFFSILLLGALLINLHISEVILVELGDRYARLASTQGWATFLFASYLFGHLIFLLGSWLDEFYGRMSMCTKSGIIGRVLIPPSLYG